MKKRLTRAEYFAEVQACAAGLRAESLRKTAENHPWVIDLGMNLEILRYTRNDHAYFTEYGPMLALGYADAIGKMAFAAFQADVAEAMSELETGTVCKPA